MALLRSLQGFLVIVAAVIAVTPASAAESASYRLDTGGPSYATESTLTSPTYQLQGGVTWHAEALQAANYTLVPGPGPASSSSSAATSSAGEGTAPASTAHGGHEQGVSHPVPTIASSASSAAVRRTAITRSPMQPPRPSSAVVIVTAPHPAATGERPSSVSCPGNLCRIESANRENAMPAEAAATHPASGGFEGARLPALDIGYILLFLWLLSELTGGACVIVAMWRRKPERRIARCQRLSVWLLALVTLGVVGSGHFGVPSAFAAQTVPSTYVYNGRLLDSAGSPVTSAQSVRFSYWKSPYYTSSDTTGTGAINTAAGNYAGWQEVHTVTPNSSGYFTVALGDTTALPNMAAMPASTLLSLYLQVEVKPAAAADTVYELLKVNAQSTPTIDRSQVASVPFASNADMLDRHDTRPGSSKIPVLDTGALLPVSVVPGATNKDAFTIDADNTANDIALQFGTSLGKKLDYNIAQNTFNFNASVQVQGNLTVTGLINGLDLANIRSSTGALKASSGGGLNLNVAYGSYRLAGTIVNYPGGQIALTANATNYVFFGSGGLAKNTTGFPTDESYIPLAQVVTTAGSIFTVGDSRVLQNDDRERTVTQTFNPAFEKASYQGDGTDNVGQLSLTHDNISLNNFYLWTSTRSTLQDYDIFLRVPVSPSFVRWKTSGGMNPINLSYRSTSSSSSDNKLDLQVFDTNGAPVSLSGSVTNLASTSWATTQVEFTGSPTWTPGQDMLITLKVSAKNNFQMHVGSLKLNYVDMPGG